MSQRSTRLWALLFPRAGVQEHSRIQAQGPTYLHFPLGSLGLLLSPHFQPSHWEYLRDQFCAFLALDLSALSSKWNRGPAP